MSNRALQPVQIHVDGTAVSDTAPLPVKQVNADGTDAPSGAADDPIYQTVAAGFGAVASALYRRTRLRSLITWGPAERALAQSVVAASGGAATLAPATSVADLAVLMRDAALAVSGDTGPLHIAAAMGTPVVALFGPSGEKTWGPWRVAHRIVTSDHPCRPCGNDGCGGGKVSECLTTLPVDDVLRAAQQLLADAR